MQNPLARRIGNVVLALGALVALSSTVGCVKVAPYERGTLAHPTMVTDDMAIGVDAHVRGVSEARRAASAAVAAAAAATDPRAAALALRVGPRGGALSRAPILSRSHAVDPSCPRWRVRAHIAADGARSIHGGVMPPTFRMSPHPSFA